jgi:hypothetical protein
MRTRPASLAGIVLMLGTTTAFAAETKIQAKVTTSSTTGVDGRALPAWRATAWKPRAIHRWICAGPMT